MEKTTTRNVKVKVIEEKDKTIVNYSNSETIEIRWYYKNNINNADHWVGCPQRK